MNSLMTTTKRLIFGLLLLQTSTSLHAAAPGNYTEMGLALATIPVDIAANRNALKGNDRRAAFLHLIADTLSLANKSCFFYNNLQAQVAAGQRSLASRDLLVNGTLAAIDAKNFLKHFKQFISSKSKSTDNFLDDDLLDDDLEFEENELDKLDKIDQIDKKKISRLAYTWKVVALPSLKGLSAFALACSQEGATNYSNVYARNLTTAAHSFIKLLSEYSALEVSSGYKTLLSAALMVNATWLVYEAKQYYSRPVLVPQAPVEPAPVPQAPAQPEVPYVPMPKVQGDCPVCFGNEELDQLHCGHSCCRECRREQLETAYNERGVRLFNQVQCTDPNCQEIISRDELREITGENRDMIRAYDEAANPIHAENTLSDAQVRAAGHKRCPNPVCRVPIEKGDACRHVVCTRCQHHFCWWCLRDDYNYQHEAPACQNADRIGADPNIQQAWNYERRSLQEQPPIRRVHHW